MNTLPELESPTDSAVSSSARIPLSQFVRKSAPIEVGTPGRASDRKPPAWGTGGSGGQAALEGTSPPGGPSFRNIQVRCSVSRQVGIGLLSTVDTGGARCMALCAQVMLAWRVSRAQAEQAL